MFADAAPQAQGSGAFQVSARKYRPQGFEEMIGQDVLVRTLQNAIRSGRVAHAFIMTGERGTGKTTTARIIARALNCLAGDGPQLSPCGHCENCKAIAQSSHVDVLEIDAASRTGVDDMREVIDSVAYRPVQARYKVYIIDEVHMLSKSAFNALLKTLEEPPEHVKFIFATTEINKVPITVLSRCQRFDLRRVSSDLLAQHFAKICESEALSADPEALALIARAADGSVRDGLSLLDQAIAQSDPAGEPRLQTQAVTLMLGSADSAAVIDLAELALSGQIAVALDRFDDLYAKGAQPKLVLRDLASRLHLASRIKVAPEAGRDPSLSSEAQGRLASLAERLSLPALMRAWQIVSQGLEAFGSRSDAKQLADMVLIKLGYAADLPDPKALVESLTGPAAAPAQAASPIASPIASPAANARAKAPSPGAAMDSAPARPETERPETERQAPNLRPDTSLDWTQSVEPDGGTLARTATDRQTVGAESSNSLGSNSLGSNSLGSIEQARVPDAPNSRAPNSGALNAAAPQSPIPNTPDMAIALPSAEVPLSAESPSMPTPMPAPMPGDFVALVALFEAKRKARETSDLRRKVALVDMQPGQLRLVAKADIARDFPRTLASYLEDWTGQSWQVDVIQPAPGQDLPLSLAEQEQARDEQDRQTALAHPDVQRVMATFPNATLSEVTRLATKPLAP